MDLGIYGVGKMDLQMLLFNSILYGSKTMNDMMLPRRMLSYCVIRTELVGCNVIILLLEIRNFIQFDFMYFV